MIVILLILAGITIATLGGENGLFARAKQAKEETQKETATEQINLLISDVYVKSYAEKQEEPTLQDLADGFCNAEGTEYVDIKTRNVSALATVDVTGYTAIYVKLEKYPYEFKIDDTLKIASIDGVEVSSTIGSTNNGDTSSGGTDSSDSTNNSNNSNSGISSEQYEAMQATIVQLQEEVSNLTDSLKNYATKEYADSLPQNVGNYTDLSWTLLGSTTSTSYVKADANIDDYNYIVVVTKDASNSLVNPAYMGVEKFKTCTSSKNIFSSMGRNGSVG
jgi:hypothetical protein